MTRHRYERPDLEMRCRELRAKGMSTRRIADELGEPETTVRRFLDGWPRDGASLEVVRATGIDHDGFDYLATLSPETQERMNRRVTVIDCPSCGGNSHGGPVCRRCFGLGWLSAGGEEGAGL